jgi:hypothetical protein
MPPANYESRNNLFVLTVRDQAATRTLFLERFSPQAYKDKDRLGRVPSKEHIEQ